MQQQPLFEAILLWLQQIDPAFLAAKTFSGLYTTPLLTKIVEKTNNTEILSKISPDDDSPQQFAVDFTRKLFEAHKNIGSNEHFYSAQSREESISQLKSSDPRGLIFFFRINLLSQFIGGKMSSQAIFDCIDLLPE